MAKINQKNKIDKLHGFFDARSFYKDRDLTYHGHYLNGKKDGLWQSKFFKNYTINSKTQGYGIYQIANYKIQQSVSKNNNRFGEELVGKSDTKFLKLDFIKNNI